MIEYTTTVNDQVLNTFMSSLSATPQAIQQIMHTDVEPVVRGYMERELKPYPRAIRPGVFKRFASPKQFRFVMMKIRRGEWTGRTGALEKAWATTTLNEDTGASVHINNNDPKARFVVGDNQQLFHADTGWVVTRDHAADVGRLVAYTFADAYLEHLMTVAGGRN